MLPILNTPQHEVKLFSVPKPVVFRPYLVKEEKLLLMAQASDDPKEVERAVRQIVTNCTNGSVNVGVLPSFDLELLFLQLRARSVNNVIEVKFRCERNTANGACGTLVPVSINIDDIKLTVPEGHTNRIMLSDSVGVVLKYPTADDITEGMPFTEMLAKCLGTIFTTSGDVHEVSEYPAAEVAAFIDNLSVQNIEALQRFFDTMPRLSHTVQFKCPKCEYSEEITLQGLADFFD